MIAPQRTYGANWKLNFNHFSRARSGFYLCSWGSFFCLPSSPWRRVKGWQTDRQTEVERYWMWMCTLLSMISTFLRGWRWNFRNIIFRKSLDRIGTLTKKKLFYFKKCTKITQLPYKFPQLEESQPRKASIDSITKSVIERWNEE